MMEKVNKKTVIVMSAAALALGGIIVSGVIFPAHATAPITAEFVCCSDEFDYEPITLEFCPCSTGLEVKEQLASALNEGIAPTEIFLLSDIEGEGVQIYDTDTARDYISDGDTVYYTISPIADGELYGDLEDEADTCYRFECVAYDQCSGQFYYTLSPME